MSTVGVAASAPAPAYSPGHDDVNIEDGEGPKEIKCGGEEDVNTLGGSEGGEGVVLEETTNKLVDSPIKRVREKCGKVSGKVRNDIMLRNRVRKENGGNNNNIRKIESGTVALKRKRTDEHEGVKEDGEDEEVVFLTKASEKWKKSFEDDVEYIDEMDVHAYLQKPGRCTIFI